MQSFFALRSKTEPLIAERVQQLDAALREALSFSRHITQSELVLSRCRQILFACYTNEPTLNLWRDPQGVAAFASGYTSRGSDLLRAKPDSRFGRTVSDLPGRFSAAVFHPESGELAVANSAVRVDPIFYGENDSCSCTGTQASAIAHLLSGRDYRYDLGGLFTLINTGFFGTHDTAFEGVKCLPPMTTRLVRRDTEQMVSVPLSELKRGPKRPSDELARQLARHLSGAMGEMYTAGGPLELSLTGGKDSRLLVAAALDSGLDLTCSTQAHGEWNAADVYVARMVADALALPHRVVEAQKRSKGTSATVTVDYLRRAAINLRTTDCGLYAYDVVRAGIKPFTPVGGMAGLGGEILRGGFAEKHKALTPERALEITSTQFARSHRLFREDITDRYMEFLRSWASDYRDLGPHDLLDCLYAEFRCGRWIAATSRSGALRSYGRQPYLDNRMTRTMLEIPAVDKTTGQFVYEILRVLSPKAAGPPARKPIWPGSTEDQKAAIRTRYPKAFTVKKNVARVTDWRRAFPPTLVDHIQRYCLHEGRIELLRSILDMEQVTAFLKAGQPAYKKEMKVVHGLYSACVLASGEWRRTPTVSEPLQLEV